MGENKYPAAYQGGNSIGATQAIPVDTTLRQNIDLQIKYAEDRVEELRAIKARMEATGLLDARIDDMRQAMRY